MRQQIITTPGGERLVVVPEKEFNTIIAAADDKADAEAVRAFYERLARGEDELIPSEVVGALLDGGNKVKIWREHRGMKAKDLAQAAGISVSFLSQIESGQRDGSFGTIKKIATALQLSVDDLA